MILWAKLKLLAALHAAWAGAKAWFWATVAPYLMHAAAAGALFLAHRFGKLLRGRGTPVQSESLTTNKSKETTMLNKEIKLGENAKINLGQGDGKATISIEASADAGGGDMKGFASVKLSASAQIEEKVLIDAGFAALEAKMAGNAAIIGALEGLKVMIEGVAGK